ncbi:MAG: arsenate reductase (glutaredoxin) [Pseudomonadota bacterium]
MSVVIYHNPACSKSRETLALIRASGIEPEIVAYLKVGWTRELLESLFSAAGVSAREALRTRGALAGDLGLLDPGAGDDALLTAMIAHPELVERPFVRTARGTRLCRPPERVHELIDPATPGASS